MRSLHRGDSGHKGSGTLYPSPCKVTGLTPAFHFLLCIETMAKHLAFHLPFNSSFHLTDITDAITLNSPFHTNSAAQLCNVSLDSHSTFIPHWFRSFGLTASDGGMAAWDARVHVLPAVSEGLVIPGRGHYTRADKIPAISLYTNPSLIRLCSTLGCASLCNCLCNQN